MVIKRTQTLKTTQRSVIYQTWCQICKEGKEKNSTEKEIKETEDVNEGEGPKIKREKCNERKEGR